MATNPRIPESPGQPREVHGPRVFPWPMVTVILIIALAIGLAWYFFH